MNRPALMCHPAPSVTPRGCAARVQPEVGRSVDVSALSYLDCMHAIGLAQEAAPELMREASCDVPPGSAYALLERFCQLYEGARGEPFKL